MSGTKKTIGLSESEFKILLSAYHISSLVCFEEDTNSFSQEDYNRGIASLFTRGFLISKEESESLSLSEELKPLLEGLKNATASFLLSDATGKIPSYMIYVGKKDAVIATPGVRKDEYIRMSLLPRKELFDWLEEAEILPPDFVPEDLREESIWQEASESKDAVFEVFFYETDDVEPAIRFQIVPENIGYELIKYFDGKWQRTTYGKAVLKNAMRCFTEEGKNGFS